MAFNSVFISGLSEKINPAPQRLAVFEHLFGPRRAKYWFSVYVSFRHLLFILEFLLISRNKTEIKNRKGKQYTISNVFLNGFHKVFIIVMRFEELVISQNLLEIELIGVHFWRLWFFELFEHKIQFFNQKSFFFSSPQQCIFVNVF